MKKDAGQTIAIILIALVACLVACKRADNPKSDTHYCRWEKCPYWGLKSFSGVIHTGEVCVDYEAEGTDLYYLDLLHFEYPRASYDELETMLHKVAEVSGDDASLLNDNMELVTPKTQRANLQNELSL